MARLTLLAGLGLLFGSSCLAARWGQEAALKQGKRTPEAAEDAIYSLPGFGNAHTLPSQHYAGYVTVNETRGRNLYYYFVESERDPASDPVVLWLNGGPGCSSFDGFVYEQGPFVFHLDRRGRGAGVSLAANPYAWSKVANMIFLDSPAGVGMSYSEHAADYTVDDYRTALDADAFLRGWFKRFPQYQGHDFYISGESYAGVYVPMLVRQVLAGNEAGAEPHINIKGYLVGNGVTDERYDANAFPLYAAGKSLIPWRAYQQLEEACQGDYSHMERGSTCHRLWSQLEENLAALNVYDTLLDCFRGGPKLSASGAASTLTAATQTGSRRRLSGWASLLGGDPATWGPKHPDAASKQAQLVSALRSEGLLGTWPLAGGAVRQGQVLNWAHVAGKVGRLGLTPPCTDSRAGDLWLNDPDVRAAIHAKPKSEIGPWMLCSDKINYFHTHGSMIPIHVNNTKNHGLRALIYSGDHDMAVPHTGSEAWTSELGYGTVREWRPWLVADGQVGGYVVDYEHGLSYATIRGAGHMVPETNPREALAMFQRFLDGEPLAQ